MTNNVNNELAFQLFFEEHNPYALKDQKGSFMYFATYVDAYREMLSRLKLSFFEGYIDLVLLLVDLYGFSKEEADSQVKSWRRRGFRNPVLIEWGNPLYGSDLGEICRLMHFVTETPFKEDMFRVALSMFNNDLISGKYGKVSRRD